MDRLIRTTTLVFAVLAFLFVPSHAQTTFTVTHTSDSGPGSLRAAVNDANATPGDDRIEFGISGSGPHTIALTSPLPAISETVTIDGTSEPDYSGSPVVEIDGTNAGSDANGLIIERSSVVQGLAIINFDGNGITIRNASASSTIQNNRIGVDADGNAAGNVGSGIDITENATGNLIGPNNTISANSGRGIFVGLSGADDNTITGNRIGVGPDGLSPMGNAFEGILINAVDNTTVGGTSASSRNVIGDNGRGGIAVTGGAASTTITGNFVGVGTDGATDVGNGSNGPGIEVSDGASGTDIGGTAGDAGNVISANDGDGIRITGSNTTGTVVQGNEIGTTADETALLGNGGDGVHVEDGAAATIGGTASNARNVVAGNEFEIYVASDNNVVQGNFVGTNAAGEDLGSGSNAIRIASGSGNQIGGTSSGAGNVVGYTATNSVFVGGSDNIVQGNYIGTNPSGDSFSGIGSGIRLFGNDHTVGGSPQDAGNVITNQGWAVSVESGTGHTIRRNSLFDNSRTPIDFNRDGLDPNDPGDGDDGVNRLQNSPEIQSADYNSGTNEITVTFSVPSDPSLTGSGASAYPLTIDFYRADADRDEGREFLGTVSYSTSDYTNGPGVTATFAAIGSVSETDDLIATATDADGNTSEFAAQAEPLRGDRFVVDATGDAGDADLTDDTCDDGTGSCTLRAAIQQANATTSGSASDDITFDISGTPPHTIAPQTPLPPITDAVQIDGSTEPAYADRPVVEIDGSAAGSDATGLTVGASFSIVSGLSVVNFSAEGINVTAPNVVVAGCYLGVDASGSAAGNETGLYLGAGQASIGGGVGFENVIGGNDLYGIYVETDGSQIDGTFVGTNADGDDLGNGSTGILLDATASNNVLGGVSKGPTEIAYNGGPGVTVGQTTNSTATGNEIYEVLFHDNAGPGIDHAGDGVTPNDPDDADDGPNQLQNFPEIENAEYDAASNQVTVTYRVDSAPSNSAYPLAIEFFKAKGGEGAAFIGEDEYSDGSGGGANDYAGCGNPPCTVTIQFTPPSGVNLSRSDAIVATATDANRNTSEFTGTSTVLPVELARFDAQVDADAVTLTWSTASETGNAGFEVQRQSVDGSSWTNLGFVEGGGTTSEPQTYRFEDASLPFAADSLQYRLKQVDADGTTHLSDAVTIARRTVDEADLRSVYPNPTTRRATVEVAVPTDAEEARLELFDLLGRTVRTIATGMESGRTTQTLEVSNLSPGVYFLRLRAAGTTTTQKLTVVR
jgi:CSLREA domain-containing protein